MQAPFTGSIAGVYAVDALLTTAEIDTIISDMYNGMDVLTQCLPPIPMSCAARVDLRPPGCSSCPAASYAPAQSTAATACLCNTGFEGAPGATCGACSAGKFKPASGGDADSCQAVPAN